MVITSYLFACFHKQEAHTHQRQPQKKHRRQPNYEIHGLTPFAVTFSGRAFAEARLRANNVFQPGRSERQNERKKDPARVFNNSDLKLDLDFTLTKIT